MVKALEFCSKLCRLNRIDCPGLINGGLKSLILPAAEEGWPSTFSGALPLRVETDVVNIAGSQVCSLVSDQGDFEFHLNSTITEEK